MSVSSKTHPGTVTFLFTDIVGSTELWERHGDAFLPILQAHNAILTDAITRYGGHLFKTEGDAYKIAFDTPEAAVQCAVLIQAALQRYPWPEDVGALSVRTAIHSGKPIVQGGDYFGPPLNRTARILSVAHGGQILVSEDTLNLMERRALGELRFIDLGYHRLRDLETPVHLYQSEHPSLQRRHFPPPRSLDGHAHNLPVQRASFIGRQQEIEQIAALLARDDTPLLTLTGPPGIGKTRLSLQAAAERIEWFPDGVWFVRLTDAPNDMSAALEVARTIGIPLPPGVSPMEAVRNWLSNRRCLLILDDCGHVPEVGRFIRELLSGASSLRCLATTRESIREVESAEMTVQGLSVPEENADAAGVLASESGQMFVDRVSATRPDFELNNRRAPTISRLLRRLGGVPESVEKAAEMMKSQSPTQILNTLCKEALQTAEEVGSLAAERGRELLQKVKEWHDLAAVESRCREALQIYQRIDDKAGIAMTLRQLGKIAFEQKDLRRAVTLLGAAHQEYTKMQLPDCAAVAAELENARRALGQEALPVALPLDHVIEVAMGHGA